MKPLAADQVIGVWGTVLLPIEGRGDIIWDRLAGQLDVLRCPTRRWTSSWPPSVAGQTSA